MVIQRYLAAIESELLSYSDIYVYSALFGCHRITIVVIHRHWSQLHTLVIIADIGHNRRHWSQSQTLVTIADISHNHRHWSQSQLLFNDDKEAYEHGIPCSKPYKRYFAKSFTIPSIFQGFEHAQGVQIFSIVNDMELGQYYKQSQGHGKNKNLHKVVIWFVSHTDISGVVIQLFGCHKNSHTNDFKK